MDIPKPDNRGTSGDQVEGEGEVVVIPKPSISNFAETMQGLAATDPKKLGGRVGSQLMAVMTGQLYTDLHENKNEVKNLRTQLDTIKDQLYDCKTKTGVLKEKLKAVGRIILGGNTLITIGLVIFGFGFNMLEKDNQPSSLPIIIIVLGSISTISGWLMGFGGKNDTL